LCARKAAVLNAAKKEIRVIIAGGGTGGHLFPGIAVAKEFEKRYSPADIRFVIGQRKMESEILSRLGYTQETIRVKGIKGRGGREVFMVLFSLPYSLFQSFSILKRFTPHLVLGMGGYSAGPVCIAARIMGIPTAIHEQNSFPGLTNRLLARVVDRIFISWAISGEHLSGPTPHLTGNPVRADLVAEAEAYERTNQRFTVLVVGGSLGAQTVNRAFAAALEILKAKSKTPNVIHQSGEMDYDRVIQDYEERGIKGDIVPFIQDMGVAYGRSDLVVGRAGATTISELAALGKPSILIPYPFAANRHQEINAKMLAQEGGAVMILEEDLNGDVLSSLLTKYMDDESALEEMGKHAAKIGRRDAAKVIVDHLETMRS
jgi:UDP-N-acetylglucosamine--N-acetylmuramyl-(pentapeptide) pyrophosphoryl-undecaprenol N-acetylglucosamine transferase